MRRRIRSESELKVTASKPPLVAHSRSVNLSYDSASYKMQLIGQEKEEITANSNSIQTSRVDMPSASEPESRVLLQNISYNNPCENESIPLSHVTGRPTSLSSVTSSRTSRGSDYFSSSSAIDSHQPIGGHSEIHSDSTELDGSAGRPMLNKVVEESVREEDEEGFVDDDALSLNQPKKKTAKHINNSSNNLGSDRVTKNFRETFPDNDDKESGNLVSPKDINKKLSEVDYLSPIATLAMVANPNLSYVDRVIIELLETERMYVRALEDILAEYVIALKNAQAGLLLSDEDTENLFGNIKDIYVFNRKLLICLESCDKDPVKIAQHFVSQDSAFSVYTTYCTNYPISVAILTRCMKNPSLAQFFKNQQARLGHSLPLGSYLLKPVQRILKYHLILQELAKNCNRELDNYWIIDKALRTMTNIAHHINEMKRKHEDAVHIQEIQSLLSNWQGDDLTTYGDIVLEGELRLQGAKNDRLIFLFDKMILVTKRQDGFLVCKANIKCSELTMLESIKESPLSFRISHYENPSTHNNHHIPKSGKEYTLTAKTMEDKLMWTHNIKKLMLKNHRTAIPLQAQQSILNMNTAGLDDPAGPEEFAHRVPLRRITSSITSSTFANGKPRRRSDSASRKGLPLRPWKKLEPEISDDVSSDSVPNTPTMNLSKPRFSFPRIIHSKTDSIGDDSNAQSEQAAKNKKEKRNDTKKSEKYKESVIYRRHLRRTSQPITDIEKRLSVRAPSDQEEEDNRKKKSEVSLEDFENLEDFLNFSVENKRESLSWDLQIVEPFFEQLKQEKEQKEALLAQRKAEEVESVILIPMPRRKRTRATSTTSNDSSSEFESPISRKGISKETPQPTSILRVHSPQPDNFLNNNVLKTESHLENAKSATSPDLIVNCSTSKANETKNFASNQLRSSSDDNKEKPKVASFNQRSKKDEKTTSEPAPVPKLKRSLSTQLSTTDRRRYFDRLKEIRDRRHSQLTLGSDAKSIQAGMVREMIEHHQEQMMTSQTKIVAPSRNRKSFDESRKRSDSFDNVQKRKNSLSSPKNIDLQTTVVLRRPKEPEQSSIKIPGDPDDIGTNRYQAGYKKQNYRSMDLEVADPSNRFSSMTTASLPIHFTSSSSCSSGSGNDDLLSNSPKLTPKHKALLQSEIILWRSYSEETGSNTRRSKNLVIQASPEHKDQSISSSTKEKKFLFKDVGKLEVAENGSTDQLSAEVDCVWHKLEVRDKCHPHSLDSPLTPRASFSKKSIPSTSEINKDPSLPVEVHLSKETASEDHKSNLSSNHTTSAKSDANQTQSNRPKTSVSDVNDGKKENDKEKMMSEEKRRGRVRERKSTSSTSNESTPNVMKLAQKYNQLAASANPPISKPSYRRSQSAGARKHLSDLRFSTSSNPKGQVKYDDIMKQTRKCSLALGRKFDRSISPPRRRPFDTVKSMEVSESADQRKGRTLRNPVSPTPPSATNSEHSDSSKAGVVNNKPLNDFIAPTELRSVPSTFDFVKEKDVESLTSACPTPSPVPVDALCKPASDVITSSEERKVPSTLIIVPTALEKHISATATSPTLVEALCSPTNGVVIGTSGEVKEEPSTFEKPISTSATSPTLVESLCRPANDVSDNDSLISKPLTLDLSAAVNPKENATLSPSLVEELCKPSSVVSKSDDFTYPFTLESTATTSGFFERSNSTTTLSPTLVEELCKPFSDVIDDDTNQNEYIPNEESCTSPPASGLELIARFCKI